MIKVITKRDVIKSVPGKFKRQYSHYEAGRPAPWSKRGRSCVEMIAAVQALDTETCSEADMFEAIETNWTRHACDECEADSDVLVHVGQEEDYEARWVDVCSPCLAKALRAAS